MTGHVGYIIAMRQTFRKRKRFGIGDGVDGIHPITLISYG